KAYILAGAPEVSGVNQRGSVRIQLGDKGILAAAISRMQGIRGGKVGRIGVTRQVGVSRSVYCNASTNVIAVASEVSGVKQRGAIRFQLGKKGSLPAAISRLQRTRRRKINRSRETCQVGIS